ALEHATPRRGVRAVGPSCVLPRRARSRRTARRLVVHVAELGVVPIALGAVSDGAAVHVLHEQAAAEQPVLTVVLPTYNEAGHVLDELERIERSLLDDGVSFEILVIDDA